MINDFHGINAPLSNFYYINLTINGKLWRTSEAMFVACKTTNKKDQERIRLASSGKEAKYIGRQVTLRPDWDKIKDQVMARILRIKFTQHQGCQEFLLNTGNKQLIEGNYWHDNYWGVCQCKRCKQLLGQNKLGILLMKIRTELQER